MFFLFLCKSHALSLCAAIRFVSDFQSGGKFQTTNLTHVFASFINNFCNKLCKLQFYCVTFSLSGASTNCRPILQIGNHQMNTQWMNSHYHLLFSIKISRERERKRVYLRTKNAKGSRNVCVFSAHAQSTGILCSLGNWYILCEFFRTKTTVNRIWKGNSVQNLIKRVTLLKNTRVHWHRSLSFSQNR